MWRTLPGYTPQVRFRFDKEQKLVDVLVARMDRLGICAVDKYQCPYHEHEDQLDFELQGYTVKLRAYGPGWRGFYFHPTTLAVEELHFVPTETWDIPQDDRCIVM